MLNVMDRGHHGKSLIMVNITVHHTLLCSHRPVRAPMLTLVHLNIKTTRWISCCG